MIIKKFIANTLREAIADMKKEFGDDAIVLGTKVIDDYSNGIENKLFEISASIDEDDSLELLNLEKQNKPEEKDFESEIKKLTQKVYGLNPKDNSLLKRRGHLDSAKDPHSINQKILEIKNDLIDKDVSESISETVSKQLKQYSHILNEENKDNYVSSVLGSMIPTSDFEVTSGNKPKVISIVGPTGVGKTTCIAKLAVISKILHNLNIGLITIDTYRLGALDQLKIFSEISNIDFFVAYEPSEIPKYMKKFKNKDVVFIDTVGRSQNSEDLLKSINNFLTTITVDETYLVLSATANLKNMLDVAKKFKILNYNGLIFSKLDESVAFGNILNLVSEIKVPIKYLTNGQVIPDDIMAADSEFIANMICTGNFN